MTTAPLDTLLGLVVRLDTDALRVFGDSQTNAELGAQGDRAVNGVQDFLVVHVNAETGVCTAVPLFAKTAVANQPLVEGKKSGHPDGWIGTDIYFSRWQHWRIPIARIQSALTSAQNAEANRRRYAAGDSSTLDDIRNWDGRNRAPYRSA